MDSVTSLSTARIAIEDSVLREMVASAEAGYPEEVVGLLLGSSQHDRICVDRFLTVANSQGAEARAWSYQISSADWQNGERSAKQLALELVGVFHSHPDHPSRPSSSDLEFALPNFIYIIAAVYRRTLASMQAWQLREDRSQFESCLLYLPVQDELLLLRQGEEPIA
jgi:proteasome lid subunit RPN8/RPN11